jgi:predicted dehydrogenase
MTLTVAIVGAGIIGDNHAQAILRHPQLVITAIVDPDTAAAERLAARLDRTPTVFDTLPDALAGGGVDIVVITSPSGTHAPLAEIALAAGVHLVIEKPLDASLASARRIADAAAAAETRGQIVSVICQHRFDPASVAVADAVDSGAFGRITSAVASVAWWRGQEYYDSAGWRGTWAQDGGGATMNQGVHTVDLLLWFLGRPVDVFAHTGVLAHERIEVEDVAVATVRFESGALAVLHATTAAYPGLAVRLQIHGSAGSAIIHDDQLESFHTSAVSGNQAASVVPAVDVAGAAKPSDGFVLGHLRQWDDIVDAISNRRLPGVTVADALLDVAFVKSMYLSARLGRPINVDAVLAGEFDDDLAAVELAAADL